MSLSRVHRFWSMVCGVTLLATTMCVLGNPLADAGKPISKAKMLAKWDKAQKAGDIQLLGGQSMPPAKIINVRHVVLQYTDKMAYNPSLNADRKKTLQNYSAHLQGKKITVFGAVSLLDAMTNRLHQWGVRDAQMLGAVTTKADGKGAVDVYLQIYTMHRGDHFAHIQAYAVNASAKDFKRYIKNKSQQATKQKFKDHPAYMIVPDGLFGKKKAKTTVVLWMLPPDATQPKPQSNVQHRPRKPAAKPNQAKRSQARASRRFVPFVAAERPTTSALGEMRLNLGVQGILTPQDAYHAMVFASSRSSRLKGVDMMFMHKFLNQSKTSGFIRFSSLTANDPNFKFDDDATNRPTYAGTQHTAGTLVDVGLTQPWRKAFIGKHPVLFRLGARFPKSKATPTLPGFNITPISERRPYAYLSMFGQKRIWRHHRLALRAELDHGANLFGTARGVSPVDASNPRAPAINYTTKRITIYELYAPANKPWGLLTLLRWHHAQGNSPFAQYYLYADGPYANSGFIGLRAAVASMQYIRRMPSVDQWHDPTWSIKASYASVRNPDRVWLEQPDRKPAFVKFALGGTFQNWLGLKMSASVPMGTNPSNAKNDVFLGLNVGLNPEVLSKIGD